MSKKEISIAVNGSMLDDQPTGVGVYSFNVINNLSQLYWKEQWQVLTVFTPTGSLLDKNLKIIKLPGLLLSSRYGKIAAICRFIWNTCYYPLQAWHYDLLISPTTHGSFFLNNQVITIHDLLSLRYRNISLHQRFYFKYLLPLLVSRAKMVIAVSETTRQDILHFLKCPEEKVRVIYNGYDDTRYFPVQDNELPVLEQYGVKNYFLAVGPTYPHKNFERLILAFNELTEDEKKEHPLVIAGGKKKYTMQLKELVTQLGIGEHVHFLGYVPAGLMPSLYREAFALVFPSLFEGFGIPLLEAMASGCPVIVSGTSSMPEVCGQAALYIDPLDETSIHASMKELICNKVLRDRLIEDGLAQAKKFSWMQTAAALKEWIETKFPSRKPVLPDSPGGADGAGTFFVPAAWTNPGPEQT
ncbi:glycosyltransferase family 4 protein [Flavitalea flava]